MADKPQFVDVWIIESNTVYREVPYTVVTDWIQQGRLLSNDRLRPAGGAEWFDLANLQNYAAFLPRSDPHRAEDKAEALEPVQMDLGWRRPKADDDEDVDMIPLIDVSLVLLIFFMMTASVASMGSGMDLPQAQYGANITSDAIWVAAVTEKDGVTHYTIGQGPRPLSEDDHHLSFPQFIRRLDLLLSEQKFIPVVNIRAPREVAVGVIKPLRKELDIRRHKNLIGRVGDEVSERASP